MSESIEIQPVGRIQANITPPGSKSLTNRALVCAALADGRSTLSGALDSEDTRVMTEALGQLGVIIAVDLKDRVIVVRGSRGEIANTSEELWVANSGTTARFLTPLLTLGKGVYRFDGTPRMQQRPITDLLDALEQLGAEATSLHQTGCPPVLVRADGLPGGRATVRGEISSQFLSGLLMVAPHARRAVELEIDGELVSKPYVEMTIAVMRSFGIDVQCERLRSFRVPQGVYRATEYAIEPDASAASYFFAAAAITGGEVTVPGLTRGSLQGDLRFVDLLAEMGCRVQYGTDHTLVSGKPLRGIDADMNAISDTVPTLAAVALFAEGPTRIRGVAHIRHKETDRIAAVATELRKLGATVDEQDDGLLITPGPGQGASIDTYDDHRMAMSMALVGLAVPGVVINDPDCTGKTYPAYFDDLARLGAD